MESIGKINRTKHTPSSPREPNRNVVGFTGTSINIANAMARAMESGTIPLAGSSSTDSLELAPRKETQVTTEDGTNVKVSGGKRKKQQQQQQATTPRRAAAAVGRELKEQLRRRNASAAGEESTEGEERVVKSRRLMSPAEALLDSAQAVVPAPGLHARSGSVGRRQTTFTLRPPREGEERSVSPEKGRYSGTRRHRTSQSPGVYNSFSAIVATGTGMDTTIEEESGDSGETSGSAARQNTTSMSVSALHEESSYEAMEREVQARRGTVGNGQRFEAPRQGFARPQSAYQEELSNPRQPFFPIPTTGNKRRPARTSIDNQAYRPVGGTSFPQESIATDSADEDGGGEGLAAHLPERSTRGKRHEHGEGYLGTGLAFTPNAGKARKKDSGRIESGDAEESADVDRVEDLKTAKRGAKFNTPARRKSASVGLSPPKDAKPSLPEPRQDAIKQRYHESLAYLSHLRQKAWMEPLKWVGIVGGLLGILWWLVNHAPPTDISGIERERTSHVGYLPRQTGVEDGNQGMDDLLRRLSDLETTLAILSAGETEASRDERQRSQTALDSAHMKMKQLDDDLRTERNKRDQDRRDLDQLRTTVQTVRQQVEVSSSLASSVEELGRKVETLESDMRDALSEQRMMRLLERVLPSGVPVRREKTGEVTIDPSFWTELRKVMATKAEVDSLSNKVSAIKKGTEKPASSSNVPTWKDFLDENEETLRVWAERTFDRKMVDAQVVDRFSFMSMLRDEIAALQVTMREEAVARESSSQARIDRQLGEAPVITGDVDTDIKPVLQRLIDDSLLKYSKDTLARPDYALASGGAQIVHDQTTTAMDLVRGKTAWSWLSGARQIGLTTTGRMPEVVLHPNTLPGMCWPFDGARGEVGVHLSREVRVTDVTVEHAARELVSAKSLASAPREMELWAFFKEDRIEDVEQFFQSYPAYQADSTPPKDRMILLSRFQYSPYTSQPIQTFPVHGDIQALNLATENVILRVTSNWGGEYTCLYRVRVHGQASEDFGEDAE